MAGRQSKPKPIKLFLGSAILALVLALFFAAITLYGGVASVFAARIVLVISGIVACLGFLLAEWFLNKSLGFRIVLGCLTVAIIGGGLWRLDSAIVWSRGRHLTPQQKEGFAKIRDGFPKNCGMLVYVPIESAEAQNYGKEIQNALQIHGAKANLIYAGAVEPPTGIVVGVRSSLEPCGFAGEMLSVEMTHSLRMPARLQENFLPYADETTVVIFVGIKPTYN